LTLSAEWILGAELIITAKLSPDEALNNMEMILEAHGYAVQFVGR
jgi:hypothetical protein